MTAAAAVPPAPIVTLQDVAGTAPAGAPPVFNLPAAVPDFVPESVALLLPNETPIEEFTTDDVSRQAQPAARQVVFTPSPTLVGDPNPITFTADRTDGSTVTGRLVVDYVAAAGPAPTAPPVAGADATTSSGALA